MAWLTNIFRINENDINSDSFTGINTVYSSMLKFKTKTKVYLHRLYLILK